MVQLSKKIDDIGSDKMDGLFIKTKLVPGLLNIYGDLIQGIILYGSVARGHKRKNLILILPCC